MKQSLATVPVAISFTLAFIGAAPRVAYAQYNCPGAGATCLQSTASGAGGIGIQTGTNGGMGVNSLDNGSGSAGSAIYGQSNFGIGVYGRSDGGNGSATGPYGVYGSCANGDAIHGEYNGAGGGSAVAGIATAGSGNGLYGETGDSGRNGAVGKNTAGGYGVYGISDSSYGVYATSTSGGAILGDLSGQTTGSATGVEGKSGSASGKGVYGYNDNGGYGVYGQSDTGTGVYGYATTGNAVYGTASSGNGVRGVISPAGVGSAIYGSNISGDSGAWAGNFYGSINVETSLYFAGTCNLNCPSDQRLKKNITPLTGAMDQLLKLRPVTYLWRKPEENGNQTATQTGFIAQEVRDVFPEWVGENKQGFKTLNIRPTQIIALEVSAIQTLNERADKADARADRAEKENVELRAKVAMLEPDHARVMKIADDLDALKAGKDPMTGDRGMLWLVAMVFAVGGGVIVTRKRNQTQA